MLIQVGPQQMQEAIQEHQIRCAWAQTEARLFELKLDQLSTALCVELTLLQTGAVPTLLMV